MTKGHSYHVAYLIVSDRRSEGSAKDSSGPILAEWIEAQGWREGPHRTCPDEPHVLADVLRHWCDNLDVDLILTTGGTGLSPRDQTPETTESILDRKVPGISEWIRASTGEQNRFAFLSRGISGIRGRTLIVNIPGSPRAVREYLSHLEKILPHALVQLRAKPGTPPADSHPST